MSRGISGCQFADSCHRVCVVAKNATSFSGVQHASKTQDDSYLIQVLIMHLFRKRQNLRDLTVDLLSSVFPKLATNSTRLSTPRRFCFFEEDIIQTTLQLPR